MKDKSLDEVEFKCPLCQGKYLGKHAHNPYELEGYCDWCAFGLMCGGMPKTEIKVRRVVIDKDGFKDLGTKTVVIGGKTEQERIVEGN